MTITNPWFTTILVSLLGLFALEWIAVRLNLRNLKPEPPEEFAGLFDAEAYARSQAYTRESDRFGLLAGGIRLAAFLGFWLAGGFSWLDRLVRSVTDAPVAGGLLGLSLLYLAGELLSLPFAWYSTFRIEARYGFNRTTPGVFAGDRIKGLILAAVIGLPLAALVLWLFERYPLAWVWAWLATTALLLGLQYVAPRWILPIFHKFTPLPDGPLRSAIHDLAERCRFPVRELFVIDGSRRSTKANAFFTGFGRNKRIALYDTLIGKHTQPELLAVLAHEIGHFKRGHIVQRLVVAVLQMAFIFLLMGLFLRNGGLFAAFGVEQTSVWLSLVFFTILFQPVQQVLGILSGMWSRRHEYEADAYAAGATGGPDDMISALRKLARDTLTNLTPHPLYVFLHYSHPPMVERIAALRRVVPHAP